jgi:hypothetical protein
VRGCSSAAPAGAWSCQLAGLAPGLHSLVATSTDQYGSVSPGSAAISITIAAAPSVPVITAPATGYQSSLNTLTVSGTGDNGDTVHATIDGIASCTGVVAGGAWTCATPVLAVGPHTLAAYAVDRFGAQSASSAGRAFAILGAPGAPIITTPANGSSTSHPDVVVTGTGATGSTLHLTFDGVPGCAPLISAGSWSCDLGAVSVGPHTVSASQTDAFGTSSASSATDSFTIVAAPDAPMITTPANLYTSTNTTLAVHGTSDAGATVQVLVDGQSGCSSAAPAGTWSCQLSGLSAGAHTIVAGAADQYSSISPNSAPVSITIVAPPAAPTVTGPTGLYVSSQTTLTVNGSSPTGQTVEVFVDGVPGCTALVGAGEWACQLAGLSVGNHSLTVVATDAYGSTSPGDAGAITFVIVPPPAAPILTSPANGTRTTRTSLAVDGTSDPGATVRVFVDDQSACLAVASAAGSWACVISNLSVESHSLDAVARDQYGTSSAQSGRETIIVTRAAGAKTTPTPTSTPAAVAPPTAAPTPDATPVPLGDGKLAITGSGSGHPHGGPTPPAVGVDAPTTFSTTLHAINATKITPLGAAVTGGVAAGFILLVAFPSELLKNTIRENYEMAFQWLAPTRRWFAGVAKRAKRVRINPWIGGTAIILLAAVFLGIAEPDFGFNGSSMRLWFALVLSLTAVNLIVPAVTGVVSRRAFSASISVRPLPAALLFVLASAIISRIAHIEPGFLFAGVLGVTFAARLNRQRSGVLALVAVGVTVLLGISAWIGYSAIAPVAEAHPTFWNLLWSEALSATTVESLATLVISLLPLRFLDGAILFAWKKWVWAVVYFAGVLILIFVIAPISDNWGEETAPLFGWGVFFIVFALVAVGVWALFRLRAHEEREREAE